MANEEGPTQRSSWHRAWVIKGKKKLVETRYRLGFIFAIRLTLRTPRTNLPSAELVGRQLPRHAFKPPSPMIHHVFPNGFGAGRIAMQLSPHGFRIAAVQPLGALRIGRSMQHKRVSVAVD
jgi:hypothetical protein